MAKREALGKGLSAILSDEYEQVSASNLDSAFDWKGVNMVDIDNIVPNPHQPRKTFDVDSLQELVESIKTHGIIQPLTVRRAKSNSYELISGERRLRASKLAGLKEVPAYVRVTDQQGMIEMALIENIQREDLNAIEVAVGFQNLITECSISQEEAAKRVGKKRSTVSNYLRLLKLPPAIQVGVRDDKIQMGHARAIASLEKMEEQLAVYKEIVSKGLSVRKVESLINSFKKGKNPILKKEVYDPNAVFYRQVQNRLQDFLESNVQINSKGNGKGQIVIPFHNTEDFNRIIDLLED